jgi:hypothetical protein
MLTSLAPDLWERNEPLTIFGMAIGHRMTVARLTDGSLWLHSPVAYRPELAAALTALGPVRHVVAPSTIHDTYLEGWFAAYPSAQFHGAPGFLEARPDLKFNTTLGDNPDPAWGGLFAAHMLGGVPRLNEVIFLHRPSRTLIVTDLVFNLGPDMPLLSRLLLRLNDCDCRLAVSRLFRSTIKDRAALRRSLDLILGWDFDRVVVSHGRNLDRDARPSLRDAFLFLG